MRFRILGLMAAGLLAACSSGSQTDGAKSVAQGGDKAVTEAGADAMAQGAQPTGNATAAAIRAALGRSVGAGFAALPDRGNLVASDNSRKEHKSGAYTFHPVSLSEAHALNAVGPGRELVITAPNGQPIRLKYQSHVEHEDGNWTWIGRPAGTAAGSEAIITFGEKATFGSIPYGDNAPLRLNIAAGKAWLIETDNKLVAASNSVGAKPREPDSLLLRDASGNPIRLGRNAAASAPASLTTATLAADPPTVDVLIGYTNGFATRLGGASQARTRLNFLVDVTNQAYANSQIPGRVRLVHSLQVTYPDATSNETALYELTGFDCSATCHEIPIPAALQPMHTARETYGADLISLVRIFNDPENDSCGIAWLNGAERRQITSGDENGGMSVVSDSSGELYSDDGYYCRDETFAHEVGHNMGSAHDIDTSDGDDNVLDADEYGAYVYSFGHKTEVGQGNFYTVMAYGDSGQTKYRVFSNPRITLCGGFACGVTNVADNAQSLTNTMPIIQTFRPTKVGTPTPGPNLYAIRKQGTTATEVYTLPGTGAMKVLNSGISTALGRTGTGSEWEMRMGDYNRDGTQDLWAIRKVGTSGKTEIHILNGASNYSTFLLHVGTALASSGTDDTWVFEVGHYNSDTKLDLWAIKKVGTSGKTEVHILDGNTNFQSFLLHKSTVLASTGTDNGWKFELGDYNKDGRQDLWAIKRVGASTKTEVHILNGANQFQSYLLNKATIMAASGAANTWEFKIGDFNGDGVLDLYGVKKMGSGGKTEVHVMNGSGQFQAYLANIATPLGSTGSDGTWEFDLAGQ